MLVFSRWAFSQGVAINTNGAAVNTNAMLDVDVAGMLTKAGMLIPRMTTAERDAIPSPTESLLIFNTTTQSFDAYNSASSLWISVWNINCMPPSYFVATVATNFNLSVTTFSANWTASVGAETYYLDISTTSDFSTFVTGYQNLNVGNVLTYTVTGLTCGITYYYRVKAANSCGVTVPTNIISLTIACWSCGSDFTVNHTEGSVAPVNKTVIYGTVSTALTGGTKCWITKNLGADIQAATETSPFETASGWYWQFNKPQGYKLDIDGTTRTPATAWISSIDEASDWTGANDPCHLLLGAGWRLPTSTEWNAALTNGPWTTSAEAFASVLKLHKAGYLSEGAGSLQSRGGSGVYWSANQSTNTYATYLNINICSTSSYYKTRAYPIRCLKD
ncbi:MAG: hypothetical protein A2275_10600 [Bacteroidetes bacterium RIFOXYA12_FULL_35_11]|nr:MAG: hypothetical protein A2X01_19885 [Bacteroidetes bacterium GWF2_35_48]OFY76388.1 MAG: hypothetical protein A2275_10600 [Bacteroidetes bacterium RIFOXYA12_FULL_35_11]OFY93201.1 MAG: hypothetical protein A2491_03065 [Bacteroidetes bacterium RIFOXYC12_FULL_35_7]HBX53295.1 hypothetical protein [Bacteroidales bacterium]